ncbi:hypothetical protein PAXRUDRAFT_318707 [Paxillus rubicundulus Ve08.2h10]|uniref:Uncharacterized protein n=1 Tax=Paxillus rubicundulus Ve08.2h10 TaxID=930991 RepID=A0A0D0DZV7_9AGAM|nr:hypothetical protein PAXRUDRAFT_318707 [Paxillus rubicundulus Ve08.2h10]
MSQCGVNQHVTSFNKVRAAILAHRSWLPRGHSSHWTTSRSDCKREVNHDVSWPFSTGIFYTPRTPTLYEGFPVSCHLCRAVCKCLGRSNHRGHREDRSACCRPRVNGRLAPISTSVTLCLAVDCGVAWLTRVCRRHE